MSHFVTVNITRETKPVSEAGFGLPLMLATSKELDYKIYTDISEVSKDFTETTREYKLASRMFGQSPKIAKLACYGVPYVPDADDVTVLTGALNELAQLNNEFFYLVCPENGDKEIKALAEWMSTQEKFYGATTKSVALIEELKGKYENTFLSVHDDPEAFHAEGLIAQSAPKEIGSYTWTFKQVNGVGAAKLTTTEINSVIENNGTTCINEMGILLNASGKVLSGDYIDVVQSDYFLRARLREDVFRTLAVVEKIPYTNEGIAKIVDVMDTRFKSAYRQGIIATNDAGEPDYTISYPLRSEIPKNKIAQRILPDIKFRVVIAGAIEGTEINGVLTL